MRELYRKGKELGNGTQMYVRTYVIKKLYNTVWNIVTTSTHDKCYSWKKIIKKASCKMILK